MRGTASRDVVNGRPVEEHLIQIWPAPPEPETIHKTTDQVGAGYRGGAVLTTGDPRLPHGQDVMLHVHQPLTTTDRATVELLRIDVSRGGCEFTIKAVVDVSGLTRGDRDEQLQVLWAGLRGPRPAPTPAPPRPRAPDR